MNVYDQAHILAKAMRESEEFKEYERLREPAYSDSTNKALLDEYKRLQYRLQATMAAGQTMNEQDFQRMQQIGALLQYNQEARDYLLAEFRFQKLLADIYKILADVAGIDLGMLVQG
jgi:cell fate (sporulation/competence/biofilm development) regulator YlbF (YheA/YmcA/DUF963 family)